MATDKKITYDVQGGVKNYKPSKMVTAPKKAKSSPNHPATELAYITKAEKDLLIKQNLHGSLKGKPNKGPSGIMSLDGGYNEPGGFQGGGNQSAAESGDKGAFGGGAENRARASAIRSAAINAGAGQNVNAGFFGGKYNNTVTKAEIAAAKAARNNPNNVFGAGAYDRTRGFGSTGLGGLVRGFNPLSMIAGLIGGPLASIFTSGVLGIKNKFNDVTNNPNDLSLRERLTGYKTQADYEKARTDRQVASRRDKMQSRIDQGYNSMFGMRTGPITDQQRSTLANLNTQTGVKNNVIGGDPTSTRFANFEPRIGLQTPTYQTGSVSFDPSLGNRFNSGSVNFNPGLGNTSTVTNQPSKGIMQTISDAFFSPAAAAEVRPAIGIENTPLGSMPTGDVGLNASGRLGSLSATVDAIDALKGQSVDPQINYSGTFDNTLLGGQTNVFGKFSDNVQNLGLNFNNDKGLSGGISYDAITGEPRFDIGFRGTFADGGLASMFTRRR
jgi:hypothetical protein